MQHLYQLIRRWPYNERPFDLVGMVVAHGVSIKAFLRHVLNCGVDRGDLTKEEILADAPNASFSRLVVTVDELFRIVPGSTRIEVVHEVGHLANV